MYILHLLGDFFEKRGNPGSNREEEWKGTERYRKVQRELTWPAWLHMAFMASHGQWLLAIAKTQHNCFNPMLHQVLQS